MECIYEKKEYKYKNIGEIIERGEELSVIYGCDFNIIINPSGTLSLVDLQGANLANIENEEFVDYKEVLCRLERTYLNDYGYVEADY